MAEITSHAEVVTDKPVAYMRMERVVGSHLERFGRRDDLSVSWQS
jgi:hypothetical protein